MIRSESLAMILFDEQHTAVYKSKEIIGYSLLGSITFLDAKSLNFTEISVMKQTNKQTISVVSPVQQSVLP